MFNLKRSAITLSPIFMAALVAVVALSSTPSGAAALRIASDRLGVTAHAAGGGGGAGVDALTVSQGSLVAKLAVSVDVTYTCRPVFDPNTGGLATFRFSRGFTGVERKVIKATCARGNGFANGGPVREEGLTPTPTVNQLTILVQPFGFPTAAPFRKGAALANVSVFACPNPFVASGVPPPCDFGSAGPIVTPIK